MQDWRAAIVLPKVFAWVEFRRMKFEHNRVAGMLVLSVALLGAVGWPQAPPSSVLSLARSPDGKRLATGSNEGAAKNVWDAEKDKEFGRPTVTLGIEVSLPDRAVFYIPVVGNREMLGIVPFPRGPFAGVRITPRMRADSAKIEVSALATAKKQLSEATCNEVRSWKSEDAGSYEGKKDASLLLSGLGRLGLGLWTAAWRLSSPVRQFFCLLRLQLPRTPVHHLRWEVR